MTRDKLLSFSSVLQWYSWSTTTTAIGCATMTSNREVIPVVHTTAAGIRLFCIYTQFYISLGSLTIRKRKSSSRSVVCSLYNLFVREQNRERKEKQEIVRIIRLIDTIYNTTAMFTTATVIYCVQILKFKITDIISTVCLPHMINQMIYEFNLFNLFINLLTRRNGSF